MERKVRVCIHLHNWHAVNRPRSSRPSRFFELSRYANGNFRASLENTPSLAGQSGSGSTRAKGRGDLWNRFRRHDTAGECGW